MSPMALTTNTLLDWTDGLNRIVIREKTAYRAEPKCSRVKEPGLVMIFQPREFAVPEQKWIKSAY